MKVSGQWIVPIIVVIVGYAFFYVSNRRAELLVPGTEGPQVGQLLPDLPIKDLAGNALPTVQELGMPTVLVVLRGYAGYVDPKCVATVAALMEMRPDYPEVRVVVLYPGADALTEFRRFTTALERAGVAVSGIEWGLDPELYAVGALDAYGDPALPTIWAIDGTGTVLYRKFGTAEDRPDLEPAILDAHVEPQIQAERILFVALQRLNRQDGLGAVAELCLAMWYSRKARRQRDVSCCNLEHAVLTLPPSKISKALSWAVRVDVRPI